MSQDDRRVVAGTMVGTTIEWYDFFIFAQAAGIVFANLYFKPLDTDSPRTRRSPSPGPPSVSASSSGLWAR